MKKSNLFAIDIAKNVFQVAHYKGTKEFSNRAISRNKLIKLLASEKPARVAMESCGSASYWARLAMSYGHEVTLLSPLFVKGFRTGQKTDANDARAIAAALGSPNARPCMVLPEELQALQALDRIRTAFEKTKRQLANQIRGLLLEFGIVIGQGDANFHSRIPEILEDADEQLPDILRAAIAASYQAYTTLAEQKEKREAELKKYVKQNDDCRRLMTLEGVGPVTAIGLLIRLRGGDYKSGRNAAACIGLTPQQHSSGNKVRLGHIAKQQKTDLRSNLYLGARAVASKLKTRPAKTEKERWLKNLVERRGLKCAAIALANKTVRTAMAILRDGKEYHARPLFERNVSIVSPSAA